MRLLVCVFTLVNLSACVNLPDVYLIDRHTVMEQEASGEWPELESRFRQQAVKSGPTNLAKEPTERRRERAFRVLNGEFPVAKNEAP
jgi:hypothetical protein